MSAEIGPKQRHKLQELRWRPEIAPADDKLFLSLVRRGFVCSFPRREGEREFYISLDGLAAIGRVIPDDQPESETLTLEQAA